MEFEAGEAAGCCRDCLHFSFLCLVCFACSVITHMCLARWGCLLVDEAGREGNMISLTRVGEKSKAGGSEVMQKQCRHPGDLCASWDPWKCALTPSGVRR